MRDGLTVTVVGWVANTPREVTGSGTPFTSFRLGSTPRWFDARTGTWRDGRTEWFTVKVFREGAFTVAASVQKGQPVVVHGRLLTEEWGPEEGPRQTAMVVEATVVGHDLTRGTAIYLRRVVRSAPVEADGPVEAAALARAAGAAVGGPAQDDDVTVDPWAVHPDDAGPPAAAEGTGGPVPDDGPAGGAEERAEGRPEGGRLGVRAAVATP